MIENDPPNGLIGLKDLGVITWTLRIRTEKDEGKCLIS